MWWKNAFLEWFKILSIRDTLNSFGRQLGAWVRGIPKETYSTHYYQDYVGQKCFSREFHDVQGGKWNLVFHKNQQTYIYMYTPWAFPPWNISVM